MWPIIEESVITVSVSVSIAVSPMTGAASFRRTKSMSEVSLPIRLIAIFNAFLTECTFSIVPFVPVVGQEALVRNVRLPSGSMSEVSLPIRLIAIFNAFLTECTFSIVPFVPVVGQEALVRNVRLPSGLTSPTHTSVVEFPISTPAI